MASIQLDSVHLRYHRLNQYTRNLMARVGSLVGGSPATAVDPRRTAGGFWALRNVSLTIQEGESVGLIGLNGAGKSTLLKVMAGVYRPTRGSARTTGRVTALLGLGSGFNMELSGIDNIRLAGLLFGLPRHEIEPLIADVADFSELGDFLFQPVRTYSTGMVARLGFGIATAMSPDILLIDEVLGVGDGTFRQRAEARLDALTERSAILCLCAHSLTAIQKRCQRAIWVDAGTIRLDGPVDEVIAEYSQFMQTRVTKPAVAASSDEILSLRS